jgi:hypothetical protein
MRFLEWVITLFLLIITGLLIFGFFWGAGAGDWRAIAYAAATAGLSGLACPATPLARRFPSWQRIGLVIVISYFL